MKLYDLYVIKVLSFNSKYCFDLSGELVKNITKACKRSCNHTRLILFHE